MFNKSNNKEAANAKATGSKKEYGLQNNLHCSHTKNKKASETRNDGIKIINATIIPSRENRHSNKIE